MRVPRIVDPFQPVDERFRVFTGSTSDGVLSTDLMMPLCATTPRFKTRRIDHPLGEIFGRGDAAARAPVRVVRFLW
tara:strand:+ start:577 stop:804 length:228 start_codon:yes stop_codon:yes gene_type:complete